MQQTHSLHGQRGKTTVSEDIYTVLCYCRSDLAHKVQFCLLEQYLPDGAGHPFAQKMIQHFNNLQTPLKNVETYPSLRDQEQRFLQSGWDLVFAQSLWDIYRDPCYVSHKEKMALNDAEPFDEWEEFVLFASHYFILVAMRDKGSNLIAFQDCRREERPQEVKIAAQYHLRMPPSPKPYPGRRFGAMVQLGYVVDHVAHISGLGVQTRNATIDVYAVEHEKPLPVGLKNAQNPRNIEKILLPGNFEPRMCHKITPFDDCCLLVGGRKSPHEPLNDCWKLSDQSWERVDDLPLPLFRHAQTFVHLQGQHVGSFASALLLYGGISSNNVVSNKWLLWRKTAGWKELATEGTPLTPRFGAVLGSCCENIGVLMGGMTEEGLLCDDHWEWTINTDEVDLSISWTKLNICKDQPDVQALKYMSRFGAAMELGPLGYLLIGGVSNEVIPQHYEIVRIWCSHESDRHEDGWNASPQFWGPLSPRPLLVGHSTCVIENDVIIVGGGAVCFSFGTYWNTTSITISDEFKDPRHLRQLARSELPARPIKKLKVYPTNNQNRKATVANQPIVSREEFAKVLKDGRPVVMSNFDMGSCIADWKSLDTVKAKAGADRDIVVHESHDAQMDFRKKNFSYVKKPFGTFIDELSNGSKQYLRSLATENPAGKPANFVTDFPRLASDFEIPQQLEVVRKNMHSSVIRISASVNMWLHYDVRVETVSSFGNRLTSTR